MPRGGARIGAGRPKKGEVRATPEQKRAIAQAQAALKAAAKAGQAPEPTLADGGAYEDLSPLDFLKAVQNDKRNSLDVRMRAACAAAPYVHLKPREGGLKDERKRKAAALGGGRFAPSAPPLALVPSKAG
jgi:phage terminase small subunit